MLSGSGRWGHVNFVMTEFSEVSTSALQRSWIASVHPTHHSRRRRSALPCAIRSLSAGLTGS